MDSSVFILNGRANFGCQWKDYEFGILLKQRKFCEIEYIYFQLQIGTGPVIGVWWYLVNCELRGLRFVTLGDPPGGCLELYFIRVFVDILQRLYSVNFAYL